MLKKITNQKSWITIFSVPVMTIVFAICLTPTASKAAEPSPKSMNSVRGGLEYWYLQGPALDRQDRLSISGSYHRFINPNLRGEAYVIVSPDERKKSGSVSVTEDFIFLMPAISGIYTYLFRYAASIGPVLAIGSTHYKFQSQSKSFQFFETGLATRGGLEYAFSDTFELNLNLGCQYRFEPQKLDWMYGLSLAFYF